MLFVLAGLRFTEALIYRISSRIGPLPSLVPATPPSRPLASPRHGSLVNSFQLLGLLMVPDMEVEQDYS